MAGELTADVVADDETLYRALKVEHITRDADGTAYVTSQAFFDRRYRPSVDRAALRGFDPMTTRFNPADGVAALTAETVRTTRATRNDAKGNPIQDYAADVEPVPLADNPAHAEIFGRPAFDNDKAFRRICNVLARLSKWAIMP